MTRPWLYPLLALLTLGLPAMAQEEDEYDEAFYLRLLQTEVEVENPVYKPVIFFGTGVLNFLGDVRHPVSPLEGQLGYRLGASTFMGRDNLFKLNFFVLYGNLQGHNFEISRAMQHFAPRPADEDTGTPIFINSSFSTEVFQAGIALEYSFGHIFGTTKRFRPFLSLGVAPLQFSPKANIYQGLRANNQFYHFWADGTRRNMAEAGPGGWNSALIDFDNSWETDLERTDFHDIGNYSRTVLTVPLEVGLDFYLYYRIHLRVASGLSYSFTDLLDNYNPRVAARYGTTHNAWNDMFLFTNFSFHFDLFSDPKFIRIERAFAEIVDFDYDVMFADQDMDGIFDRLDNCPDTPIGVAVDSLGCPFDSDADGVPDFADQEADTPAGSIVDEFGRGMTPETLIQMFDPANVVRRDGLRTIPLPPAWTRTITFTPGVIPDKFREVDLDRDGYIAFSELLTAVERFFDKASAFTLNDIYELNAFFFAQ